MALAKSLPIGALATALLAAVSLGGCGAGLADIEFDAPVLNAVGLNLGSKQKEEADLPERQGLVIPPPGATATLPPPGERSAAAAQNWPVDADEKKKKKVEADAEARAKYCRDGDWSGKGGINEFEKNTGRQERCASKLGEAISKSVGGGEPTAR